MKKFKLLLILGINSIIAYSYATQTFMIHNAYKDDITLSTYKNDDLKCFSRVPSNDTKVLDEDNQYTISKDTIAFFKYNDELDGCNKGWGQSTLFSLKGSNTVAFLGYQPNAEGVKKIGYKIVGPDTKLLPQINYDSHDNVDGIILHIYNYGDNTQ